jgi:urease accessory protein
MTMTTDLLRLLTWFSPAFPTGAFGYSHGLETALREGRVRNADELRAWIEGLIERGSGWNDAVLFAAAFRTSLEDRHELADLAVAMSPSLERRRESLDQGQAFLTAFRPWGQVAMDPAPYPVAAGGACALSNIDLPDALTAWLHGFAANLVAVAVRAMPMGQKDGVAVMAALEPTLTATAARAAASTLDDLGGCALASDICAMRHETLDGRLFIS